jgi:predicted metallopeptidase
MSRPFDFGLAIRRVCDDMIVRLPELAHIDMSRVAVGFSQTRKAIEHGLFASLTPLRFSGGAPTTIRRGRPHTIESVVGPSGLEMLYILNFYLPRFQNLDLHEKLITILHELWHISPDFNGDIRRHAGRYHAHSHSQKEYDQQMGLLADRWLAELPPEELWVFLREDFAGLAARYPAIVGLRIRRPRILPLAG